VHPCPLPLGLCAKLVKAFVAQGGLVLDPFCGTGQVLRAALQAGRRATGIDLSPRYCRYAARAMMACPGDSC
jgi:DNA modification methylase